MVYGAAFFMVLAAAVALFLGLVEDSVKTVVASILASSGALLLLAIGVARSSRSPEVDRHR